MEKNEEKDKKNKEDKAKKPSSENMNAQHDPKGPESAGGRGRDELGDDLEQKDPVSKKSDEQGNFKSNRDFVKKQDMHNEDQRMYAGAAADQAESGHSLGGDTTASALNFGEKYDELEKNGTSNKPYQAYKENKYPDEGNLHSDYNEYDAAGTPTDYSGSGNRAAENSSSGFENSWSDDQPETNQKGKKKKGSWKNPY